ncbi:MAG: hypothetical protein IJ681_00510 [Bacteroidales bacterium]|nr:hypothetical protein [Bacteroidales bacterium]MBR1625606.1 hypothetical protein [Bacteroidales bacterium]
MTDKNIQIQDLQGNNLFPKTKGAVVLNNSGDNLGGVEAGAQVNVLETIDLKYGNTTTSVTIASKKATIDLSAYAKSATTLSGYGITDAYTKNEIDGKISSAYKVAGSAASVSALGSLDASHEGYVYNMTAQFTTTADFVEGSGKKHPAGTNVAVVNTAAAGETAVYKYDVLAGFIDTSSYDTHIADTDIHVTTSDKSTWNGKQDAIADLSDIRTGAGKGATAVQPGDLATVATSGSYNDLSNKPTIPDAQIQSDWNQTTTTAKDYIKNKPSLATVATTGSYNDLSDKPTIPQNQITYVELA